MTKISIKCLKIYLTLKKFTGNTHLCMVGKNLRYPSCSWIKRGKKDNVANLDNELSSIGPMY